MASTIEISRAAQILRAGGLVAFPTETVYGLGADATSDRAVARVYAVKGRPQFNPLIAHVASLDAAREQGDFDALSLRLAEAFWPGPLTLVVPRSRRCTVSLLASAGLPTIALRVPAHPMARQILETFSRPVVAPSANPSGRLSPTSAEHVRAGLGGAVDLIVDGGGSSVGIESTVIRVMQDGPYQLRAGGISRADIERVLGRNVIIPAGVGELHAPGQLASHYAPRAPLRLNAATPVAGETYLGFAQYNLGPHTLTSTGDLVEAAANLFRLLHEIDSQHPAAIAVAPIPNHGLGEAINDRLRRAAAPRP